MNKFNHLPKIGCVLHVKYVATNYFPVPDFNPVHVKIIIKGKKIITMLSEFSTSDNRKFITVYGKFTLRSCIVIIG